jgi:hypothetical protein
MTIETHYDNHPHAMIKDGRVIGKSTFADCNDTATIVLIRDAEWQANEAIPLCGNHEINDACMYATWDGHTFTPPTPEYLFEIGVISEMPIPE